MFTTKNLSPRALAFYTSLALAVIVTLFSFVFHVSWKETVGVFAITLISGYFLYSYTMERFIYRKIKLIYKFIYQTKATRKQEFFYENILPRKSLEQVSQDVEKWAIQKREEIENLQQNEQFRKEFLTNLAHELKTPIFSVQGYVHTLLDGALEDEQVNRVFLQNAAKSIDRLVRLVDDLDEISQLESGRMPVNLENFVIQDLVQDIYEELSMKAQRKSITLSIKKGTEKQLWVLADKPKIKQVLINLIENSIKYGNNEGNTSAGFYDMGDTVYVEISDDGPGISEEHLPRIFERFYRADRSRSREVGGTGLGLAIVKHIVEAHGQTVNCRSKPDVGSSFGFTLQKSDKD